MYVSPVYLRTEIKVIGAQCGSGESVIMPVCIREVPEIALRLAMSGVYTLQTDPHILHQSVNLQKEKNILFAVFPPKNLQNEIKKSCLNLLTTIYL